jgi:hypothetical protein
MIKALSSTFRYVELSPTELAEFLDIHFEKLIALGFHISCNRSVLSGYFISVLSPNIGC